MRRILLVDIGTLAAPPPVTPPLPRVPSEWVPNPRPSPDLAPPTGLSVAVMADAAQLTWTRSTQPGTTTVVEAAADHEGGPDTWYEVANTTDATYTIALPSGPFWVRVYARLNGLVSVRTNAVLAVPVRVSDALGGLEAELLATQTLVDAAADAAAAAAAAAQAEAATRQQDVAALQGQVDAVSAQIGDILEADEWSTASAYPLGDLVQYQGKLYRALQAVPAGTPLTDDSYWQFIGNYDSLGAAVGATVARVNVHDLRIEQTEDDVTATAQTVSQHATRLTGAETGITANSSAIALVQTQATANKNNIATNTAAILSINSTLTGKADSSALSALTTTVSQQGDTLTSQSQSIASLQNAVTTKADASALSALTNTVTAQGDAITSNANSLTALSASIPQTSDNLVLTSNFDGGTIGRWMAGSVTTSGSPTRNFLRVTEADGYVYENNGNRWLNCEPGDVFDLSAMLRTCQLRLNFYDADNVYFASTTLNSGPTGVNRVATSGVVPANATRCRIAVRYPVELYPGEVLSYGRDFRVTRRTGADAVNGAAIASMASTVSQQGDTITAQGTDLVTLQARFGARSANLIEDGSFESALWALGDGIVYVDNATNPWSGCAGAMYVHSNGRASTRVAVPPNVSVPVEPGRTYRIRCVYQTNAAYNGTVNNGKLRVGTQFGGVLVSLPFELNAFGTLATDYTVPTNGSVSALRLTLSFDHTDGWARVDDVSCYDVTDALANSAATELLSAVVTQQGNAITSNAHGVQSLQASIGQSPDNLVLTSNFDDGTIGRWAKGAIIAAVGTPARNGLRVTEADGSVYETIIYPNGGIGDRWLSCEPDDVFELAAMLRTCQLRVNFYDATRTYLGGRILNSKPSGFSRVSTSWPALPGSAWYRIAVRYPVEIFPGESLSYGRDFTVRRRTVSAQVNADAINSTNVTVSIIDGRVTANANDVSSLSTTVGNHTTTLTSYGSSIDGIRAKAGVVANVNGQLTGWQLLAGGGISAMSMFADNFSVTGSTTANYMSWTGGANGLLQLVSTTTGGVLRMGGGFGAGADKLIFGYVGANSGAAATQTLATQKVGFTASGKYKFGSTWGSAISGWPSGATISYTSTASAATINVAAGVLQIGDQTISYNAASVSVTYPGINPVRYYMYYDDPGMSGGSMQLKVSSNAATQYNSDGRVLVGTLLVTFSAGGSGSGGPNCPARTAYVMRRRGEAVRWVRAKRVRPGDWLRVMDPVTGDLRWGLVTYSQPALAACVTVVTAAGIQLTCSRTAPIGTPTGALLASDTAGHVVSGYTEGVVASLVSAVIDAGNRWVQHIICEDTFFLASDRAGAGLAHHNLKADKPELP